ncbi:hypothetical protein LOK49_LG07G02059 [Camellia lanceoleosa]|uniref:Uncharacterized protein n=1 Tax=Camellia lanceoleosa TaxID=1840588 RepID=A0ACC0H6Y6_9ERIC|nr:hypothetical protein LOK49_LG07G02059 [Camellia lanceoleosa]
MVFWGSLSNLEEMAQDDEAKHITREDAVQAELWFLPLLSLFPSHFTWKQFTKLLSLGKVKVVPFGDSLLIMGSAKAEIPLEKTITLSSLLLQDW